MSEPTAFHLALEAAREAAGLSIAKACDVIGISVGTWTYWKQHEPVYGKQKRALNRLAEVTAEPELESRPEMRDGQAELPVPPTVKAVGLPVDDSDFSTISASAEEFDAALKQAKRTPEGCQANTQKHLDSLRRGSDALIKAVGLPAEDANFTGLPTIQQPLRRATVPSISAPMSQGIIPPVEVPDQRATTTKPEPQYLRFNV